MKQVKARFIGTCDRIRRNKGGEDYVWEEEFDETLRCLDFEVFNMLDKHDITRCS